MSDHLIREVEAAQQRAREDLERAKQRAEDSARLTNEYRDEFYKSEQGGLHAQIRQAEADMAQSPAPDRGGFGDHDGDRFAETPESVKPTGAPPATADGSVQKGSIPPGAPATPQS